MENIANKYLNETPFKTITKTAITNNDLYRTTSAVAIQHINYEGSGMSGFGTQLGSRSKPIV